MKTLRVLDVGQCDMDHGTISRFLESHFDVEVDRAHHVTGALALLRGGVAYDLVLVNRLLDADGSEGIGIIHSMKSDAALKAVPVMLVSNFAASQDEAVAAGAIAGFGKAQLGRPETLERLNRVLGARRPPTPQVS